MANRPGKNLARRLRRRKKQPGYPIEARHLTLAEIRDYFSGDRIVCLMCGRAMRSLHAHLGKIHGITAEYYRTMYGLPWRTGLSCGETRDICSDITKRRIEDGYVLKPHPLVHQAPKRPRHSFQTEIARINIGIETLDPGRFRDLIAAMKEGQITLHEASKLPGMPSSSWAQEFMRNHSEARAEHDATLEALPFAVQARAHKLSDRFYVEVSRRRGLGESDATIGRALGVSTMTVNLKRRKKMIA
jgi:hypothetical protein